MISADQIVCHLVGDYILQSDWMATRKRVKSSIAFAHATCYMLPFLFLHPSPLALFVMWSTHGLIDRFGLARYVVWAKNFIAPPVKWFTFEPAANAMPRAYEATRPMLPWRFCYETGYPLTRDKWLVVWLLIIADNIIHLLINGAALKWL